MRKNHVRRLFRLTLRVFISPLAAWWFISGRQHAVFQTISQTVCWLPGGIGSHARIMLLQWMGCQCSDNKVHINIGTLFEDPRVEIGKHVYISSFCNIGWARIEDYVMVASGAHIMCGKQAHFFNRTDIPIALQGGNTCQVRIGYGTWVGSRAIIMADVGEECVIGAGTVVTKPIPAWSIAVGVPARVIGTRKANEQMKSLQNKEYVHKDGIRIPTMFAATLAEVEEAAETIQRLQAVTDILPTHLVLEELHRKLLDRIRQALVADTVALLMFTEDKQHLYVRATIGLEEEIAQEIQIPLGRGFAGSIAASGEPMIVDDLSTVEVVSPILRNKGLQSMVGVPLLVERQVVGVFHLGAISPHRFTKDDALLLQLIADRVKLATTFGYRHQNKFVKVCEQKQMTRLVTSCVNYIREHSQLESLTSCTGFELVRNT